MSSKKRYFAVIAFLIVVLTATMACGLPFIGGDEESESAAELPQDIPTDAFPDQEAAPEGMPEKPEGAPEGMQEGKPERPEGAPDGPPPDGEKPAQQYDSPFPLPQHVENYMELSEEAATFQTDMTIEEAVEFYRKVLTKQGLTERTLLTMVEEGTFSIVFDGSPNGKAMVIQGTDFGDMINISIRFEDV